MSTPESIPSLPAGSDAELTAAFLSARAKERFVLCEALRDELLSLTNASEAVAPVKIAWWRDEILRAAAGEPRHPLTISLHAATSTPGDDWDLFSEHLVLAESWLRREQTSTLSECRLGLFRQYGPGLYWCFDAVASTPAEATHHVHHVAIARGFTELAAALVDGRSVARTKLPLEWLDAAATENLSGEQRHSVAMQCVAAGVAELDACSKATIGERTTDVLAALLRGRLAALGRGREPGRIGRLVSAWRAARHSSSPTEQKND